ncbi:MAG: isoprenylcysteine carboxylmethyltransferase family protein [Deltaproteobacteria bacterium]|nr:isoprenylcysteine carboxylmethyltransferase family protein [Deltaproteobacteria bacterium]
MSQNYAYGKWPLVVGMIIVALFFITRYIPIKTKFEKRSGGVLYTFIIALFAEMYGFPLTIYILSTQFGLKIPLTHSYGHLSAYLLTFLGIKIAYGWALVMIVSNVVIVFGVIWITKGWSQVYHSDGKLVTTGIYSRMRHPQYSGIILVAIGFLIQWPTLITLFLFPFLIVMYYRLAMREEHDVEEVYGPEYIDYKKNVPAFIPRLKLGLLTAK